MQLQEQSPVQANLAEPGQCLEQQLRIWDWELATLLLTGLAFPRGQIRALIARFAVLKRLCFNEFTA